MRVYRGTCTSPDTGFFLSDHASLQVQMQGATQRNVLRDGRRNRSLLIATNVRDLFGKPRLTLEAILFELLQNMTNLRHFQEFCESSERDATRNFGDAKLFAVFARDDR